MVSSAYKKWSQTGSLLRDNSLYRGIDGSSSDFLSHLQGKEKHKMHANCITLSILFLKFQSYKDKTGKMRSFFECIRPLIPLLCFVVVMILWINKSPSDIIENDPRAV